MRQRGNRLVNRLVMCLELCQGLGVVCCGLLCLGGLEAFQGGAVGLMRDPGGACVSGQEKPTDEDQRAAAACEEAEELKHPA